MKLTPAQYVIHVFGGVRATARVVGRSPAAISKWHLSKKNQGRGGIVPTGVQSIILKAASKKGLDIKPEDLVIGREIPDYKCPVLRDE